MTNAIFEGGGDYPASRAIIGSGEGALLVRYFTGRAKVGAQDQVQLEFGAAYRHYHACIMRTVLTGTAGERHKAMHAAGVEALAACQAVGEAGRDVRRHLRRPCPRGRRPWPEGLPAQCLRLFAVSANYPPSWMEEPMIYPGNPTVIEPGMVIFMHMILVDGANRLTMSLGETGIVHPDRFEPVSSMPHELVVK